MIIHNNPPRQARKDPDTIRREIREAIEAGRAGLAFQPVVRAQRPDQIAFHEGLVRIFDKDGGVMPAEAFISQVEAHEIGRELDCFALRCGLSALARNPALRLSLNMSPRTIGNAAWAWQLDSGLERDPTAAERLIIEITERSAMLFPGYVTSFMEGLRSRGISFALDDFGAGYTSFRQLRDLHFDIVKIDGAFCRGVHKDPDNRILVEALVMIGRHFDCMTVGEMIEDPADGHRMTEMGVDCLQGWLYGPPVLSPEWEPREPDPHGGCPQP